MTEPATIPPPFVVIGFFAFMLVVILGVGTTEWSEPYRNME